MKKLLLFSISLCISFLMQAQVSKIVNVTNAGTLNSLFSSTEQKTITNLTVTGTIDQRDFLFMHDSLTNLTVLDIKDITIAAYSTYSANIIPSSAFLNKALLTSIYLPTSIISIGNQAFYYCTTLANIYVKITTPPDLTNSQSVFMSVPTACKVHVPFGSIAAYKAATQWNSLLNYVEIINDSSKISEKACGSYTSKNGTTYTMSGVYPENYRNASGGDSIVTLNVTIYPVPMVAINPSNTAICSGTSKTMTALVTGGTPPYSYKWSPTIGTATITTATYTYTATPTTLAQTFCTVTDVNNCQASMISQIQVYALPSFTAYLSKNNVCQGSSVDISITSSETSLKYAWSTGDSASKITVFPTTNLHDFRVTVTNTNGCKLASSASPSVLAAPTITITPNSISVIKGQTDTLKASGATTYLWSTGATTSNIIIAPYVTTTESSFTVSVTGTNANNCSAVATQTLSILSSSDATLKSLEVSQGSLNQKFNPKILNYFVELPVGTTIVPAVNPLLNFSGASFKIDNPVSSFLGFKKIAVTAQDGKTVLVYTVTFIVSDIAVKGISISPHSTQNMSIGDTKVLTATIAPLNADNHNYFWKSSDSSVVGIDTLGNITAKKTGKAKIYLISSAVSTIQDSISINVIAQDTIVIGKRLPTSLQFVLGSVIKPYTFAEYFSGKGLTYSLGSTHKEVAYPVQTIDGFGIVLNSIGSTEINGIVRSSKGAEYMFQIPVTITAAPNATVTSNCNSLKVNETIKNVDCAGKYTGSIALMVSGGAAPYTFKWQNTRTDNTLQLMPAGNYSVLILDSNNCAMLKSYTITEPAKLSIEDSITKPSCGLSNGQIKITATGGTGSLTYKWNDGTMSNILSNKDAGIYNVTVTDGAGCIASKGFALNNTNAPILLVDTVIATACNPNNGKIILTAIRGTKPFTYEWSDGAKTKNRVSLASGFYSLTTTDSVNCKNFIDIKVPAISFNKPEISLVTISKVTSTNLIVWLKDTTNVINYYTIYRELGKSGYTSIGRIPYNSLSVFNDSSANILSQSWRYRLSATGYCGNESNLSSVKAEHKTINLKLLPSHKDMTLLWDAYEGEDFNSFLIYRNGSLIDSVPANVNHYKDTLVFPGSPLKYQVVIQLQKVIDPAGKLKADSGPFSASLSNMAESQLLNEPVLNNGTDFSVYPNPTKGLLTIVVPEKESQSKSIEVLNLLGQVQLKYKNVTDSRIPIDATSLPDGMYLIRIISGNKTINKSFVISK